MQIILIIGLIVLYIYLIYLFFAYVAPFIIAIGSIILTLAMMWRYFRALGSNLLWGEGWLEVPSAGEPAYHDYFFLKAYQDYKMIVVEAFEKIKDDFILVFGLGMRCMNPFVWFVGIAIWGITLVSAIPAGIAVVALGLIHMAIVLTIVLTAMLCAGVLQVTERAVMAWQHRFITCPECHHKISVPLYICKCSAEHKRLLPGKYGVISRRCKCGEELPTLLLLGRNRIAAFCPQDGCRTPITKEAGLITNLHFPIVGGTSAGKSSFMTATLVALKTGIGGAELSFPTAVDQAGSRDQRNFERSEGQYLRGEPMDKTADSQVSAFLIKIRDASKTERLIYSYDAAGEIFRGGHNLASLPYLAYIHGIFLLIDPYSIPDVRSKYPSTLPISSSSSPESPQDIYDTIVRSLIQHSKRSDLQNVPVAVVITKADIPAIQASITSTTPSPIGTGLEKLVDMDPNSLKIREWLISNGEGNLVRGVEESFKRVRYFECSALGRSPETSNGAAKPFSARGVVPIWNWMLSLHGQKLDGGLS